MSVSSIDDARRADRVHQDRLRIGIGFSDDRRIGGFGQTVDDRADFC